MIDENMDGVSGGGWATDCTEATDCTIGCTVDCIGGCTAISDFNIGTGSQLPVFRFLRVPFGHRFFIILSVLFMCTVSVIIYNICIYFLNTYIINS